MTAMSAVTAMSAIEYDDSGFFVLRTPLLPFEDFLNISGSGADRAGTRGRLRGWLERPEVREALWIASPELIDSLPIWRDHPESAKGQKLERALYRYLARMAARSTPFGAFAGCTLGRIGGPTRLELGQRQYYARRTRLNMEYLCGLVENITAAPGLRRELVFRPNTSLHPAAGRYHHLRGRADGESRTYELVATDRMPALDATLQRAACGETANALALALTADSGGITREDAEGFIAQLIESQVLVPDLTPPVTGGEPLDHVIEQLDRPATAGIADGLRSIRKELEDLDKSGLGARLSTYDRVTSAAAAFGEFRPGRLLHLDLIKPAKAATLDRRMISEIARAIAILHSIQPPGAQPALEQFKADFNQRYGEREVPLLEALDDEAGIGFEAEDNPMSEPLIADMEFQRIGETPRAEEETSAGAALRCNLEQLQAGQKMVLELDATLLAEMKSSAPPPLPDSCFAMGIGFESADGNPGFYLQTASGPSGANLLARFCHADADLAQCVQEHLKAEEALYHGELLFAEIAHLPEGRVGNVVCRPTLREYEIPFLATPGVPPERQIALSDLTVSVRSERIVLRSQRLACEVVPRLTSAHNFAAPNSLKLYKFLCLLQHQGVTPDLAWDWGPLSESSFLPRVTAGNVVLALARWRLSAEDVRELGAGKAHDRLVRVQAWRTDNRVSRFANIVEGDNRLLIDFESELAVETFLEHVTKSSDTVLEEMFPAPDALLARGPEGRFVHEIIVPFVRKNAALPRSRLDRHKSPGTGTSSELNLNTGSEWLFATLYCSPSQADRVLLELVHPLVKEIMSTGAADRWFFVRYADPQWHLRLRLHGSPAKLKNDVLPALVRLIEPQRHKGHLWKVHLADYEPEIERYGGSQGLGIAEEFFQLDSELCLSLLPLFIEDHGAKLRWQVALHGIDRLFSGLGFGVETKKKLVESLRQSREQEWIVDESYRRTLAAKAREAEVRQALTAFTRPMGGRPTLLPEEAEFALTRFSAGLQPIREQLEGLIRAGELKVSLYELAASYVHMHLNRMLRSSHHQQEAVLFDFLARAFATCLART
jgi:thiopeptide-type bacteriocin biosynthesis protein